MSVPFATYYAEVLADSIASDVRLTTLYVVMPRFLLPQFEKHRVFSISAESNRAVPVRKRIEEARTCPVTPLHWGMAQSGMVAKRELSPAAKKEAEAVWLRARNAAVYYAEELLALDGDESEESAHKQVVNRLLEPFLWVKMIVTATEWENFFALRLAANAQPEIQRVASCMFEAMDNSTPKQLNPGEWHLPMTRADDKGEAAENLPKLAAARCARISYATHDGRRDVAADLALYEKLASNGHMTPLEHAAVVAETTWDRQGNLLFVDSGITYGAETEYNPCFIGNFRSPWVQLRKTIPGEAVFRGKKE